MRLQSFLNENDVINSIRLQIRHPSGRIRIWILVEGENDQKLFSKLITGEDVQVEIAHGGLTSLLNALGILSKESDRILGIRDADFLHLENEKSKTAENIFLTDFHDAEMMQISCDNSYLAVVAEYIRHEKSPDALRMKFLKSIVFIGGLRWINDSNRLELNFKNLGLGDFFNVETFALKEDLYLQTIMRRSPTKKKEVSTEEVKNRIKNNSDFFNLCNGHDFQRIFALYVNANSKRGVKEEEIGRAFRIAYRFDDFRKTRLYDQLKKWSNIKSMVLFKDV
ncbi:DUF4435 domain-containing protein [candidate division KSB1 bacterium]|nr:DUF4435 domain-containing protein [candidate division KSB1 bacterium]